MARHIPGPLYFVQQGSSGMPMLFLHSTPDDHRLWLYQTARFSAWFRTIAVDLAGYGRSGPAQEGMSVGDQADAAWEVVDQISSGQVIIHGNSMGSMVSMQMASKQPHRVPALILSGTGYLPTRDAMKVWRTRYETEGIGLRYLQCLDHFSAAAQKLPHVQHYARMVCELNNPSTLGSIIAMNKALYTDPEPDEFFDTLTMPTLIMSGTADRNHAAARALHTHIKTSDFREIEGAGHAVMQEAPWTYDKFTIEFLNKHRLWPGEPPEASGGKS
ncbi:MAG TPA: alpha/beta hydrolase [Candidatus Binataceae bacterium]|nr:alpha/beta hydrolase [Candidatus Binataceae bacterium]